MLTWYLTVLVQEEIYVLIDELSNVKSISIMSFETDICGGDFTYWVAALNLLQ
jgi:hypothetical protein